MRDEIYQKLNNIENLNDRLLLKKVLNNLFTSLEEYSEERYKNLEKRVFSEIKHVQGNYDIYSTIQKRQDIDPTNQFMYPIMAQDLEDKLYDISSILKNITDKKHTLMFKVFFQCDYLMLRELIKNNKTFKGTIETDKRSYEASFTLKKNTEYSNKVIALYKSFIDNNIPWSTVNNPYISKIADVYLTDCEEGISDKEIINKLSVDFGEYAKYVKYDMVPLWNVKNLKLKSTGFPMPCEDSINYEHIVSLQKEGIEHGYLAENTSYDIQYVIRTEDTLIISAEVSEAKEWSIWKLVAPIESKLDRYDYEIISNAKYSSFTERFAFKNKSTVKTKAELIRIIKSFKASKDFQFQQLKLEDNINAAEGETYEVNYFIIDEIREDKIKKILALYFKASKHDFLTRDILSFLVSEIQLLYPEYKCEGRLV